MVRETAFYDLLGVSPTASADQIKSAYKKGALKYHPDKNKSPDAIKKFEEIQRAYEALGDPEKRKVYDSYGEAGLEGGAGGGPGGPGGVGDIFSQFFGGMHGGGFARPQGPTKPRAMFHPYEISLEDIYKGKTAKMLLRRSVLCKGCQGSGSKSGRRQKCSVCNGHGFKIITRQVGPMIQRMESVCKDCEGEGDVPSSADVCTKCTGSRICPEQTTLHLNVAPGVESGTKIVFEGQGDESPKMDEPGDVVFEIREKPHPRFRRAQGNLYHKFRIDLISAITGGTFYIQHLDDRWVEFEIIPGEVISPGMTKVIRRQGMPTPHGGFGDLFVEFDVVFPKKLHSPDAYSLNAADVKALRRILPTLVTDAAKPGPKDKKGVYDLEDVDPTRDGRQGARREDMDDDDDAPDQERVNCSAS